MDNTTATIKPKYAIWPLLCSLLLFVVLFAASYPYYHYYIDPDAVSYLTIAHRYASGDYLRAVNGLWSPFQPWLVAICIKNGIDGLLAAHLTSAAACLVIIVCTWQLLRRFTIDPLIVNWLMAALPIFLVYCLYEQLFDDLWQIVFLLCYLLIVLSKRFTTSWWLWIVCGIIGAFAYFAKTYSFYFLVLHLTVITVIFARNSHQPIRHYIKMPVTVIVTMLILMAPWIYALHVKYHKWTLSNAGAINTSWTLLGHKTFTPGINHLIPPPYDNSPYHVEDPYIGETLHSVTESPKLVAAQAIRSLYAVMQGFSVSTQLSFLLPFILLASAIVMLSKRGQNIFSTNHYILLWAALIMPLGYALMHFESRYIWLLAYVSMILGGVWLMKLKTYFDNKRTYHFIVFLFVLSYITYPVYDMKNLLNKGKDVYMEAQQVNNLGLHGTFTSNGDPNREGATALLTHMPYYTIEHFDFGKDTLLAEMRKYKVNYYFFYCKPVDAPSIVFTDENGKPFPEVTNGTVTGLKIFRVIP